MKTANNSSEMDARPRRGDPARHVRLSLSERRRFQRGAIGVRASLIIQNESYTADILDISAGGAQLRCPVVLRPGAGIEIEISGLGLLQARVLRRSPNSISLEFDQSETQRAELAAALAALTLTPA